MPDGGETTQTRPNPTATLEAPTIAGSVPLRRPVTGSIRVTVPSEELVTQTAFSPAATPLGPLPTVIVCETWFVCESIRETVPSSPLATQTAFGGNRDARGAAAHRDRLPQVVRLGIDERDCVAAGVRNPDRVRTALRSRREQLLPGSRQRPCCYPGRSRRPHSRSPQRCWSRRLPE